MPRLADVLRSLGSQPRYVLMRAVARFEPVRQTVARTRNWLHAKRLQGYLDDCELRMSASMFAGVDRAAFIWHLRCQGVARGLALPVALTAEIKRFAMDSACYADRSAACGFRLDKRAQAEVALGKPILVAQYFNAAAACPAVERLLHDPLLQWIAGSYLGSMPTFVGANLWWTFPVQALPEDRDRHAHLFHRDVDDFRFFKFFFYLTDVQPGDGAHVCVVASHTRPPRSRASDHWSVRRYSDSEIARHYAEDEVVEVCGPAGTGFAEDTLCVHKGLTPTREPRLLLQLQFALFDYGVMHDNRSPASLQMIA